MLRTIGVIAIVLLLALAGAYAAGWLTVQAGGDATTVEIKTGEINARAAKVLAEGQEFVGDAAHSLNPETPKPPTP